jgi:hypothetical protein
VTRAASTGGGRTYRGQVPVNWYAGLILIVLVGLVSVVYSRYEYRNPASAATVQPAVGTTWYAGVSFNICGTQKIPPANPTGGNDLSTDGSGLITIDPTKSADAGNNATLGRFVDEYVSMDLNATSVRYPLGVLYSNGDACPKGTPDAGKKGYVQVRYFPQVQLNTSSLLKGNPADQKIGKDSYFGIGFGPKTMSITRSPSVELAVLQAGNSTPTSTTAAGSTASTVPTTASTVPTTASTTATTVAPKTTTTTVAPKSTTTSSTPKS